MHISNLGLKLYLYDSHLNIFLLITLVVFFYYTINHNSQLFKQASLLASSRNV